MKNLTVFIAGVLLLSLTNQNVLGSDMIPYAENLQEFRALTNQIKYDIQEETLYAYPKVKKVGMHTQEKLINFDAENNTIDCEISINVNNAIMNNDSLLSGELTKTDQTIRVSKKLFHQLQRKQSCCCVIS